MVRLILSGHVQGLQLSVYLCVYLSVNMLTATYLIWKSKVRDNYLWHIIMLSYGTVTLHNLYTAIRVFNCGSCQHSEGFAFHSFSCLSGLMNRYLYS